MASTYTSNIRLEKQADGENPNAWGAILNTNVIDLVDQAVAAYQIVSVSGTTPITLTQVNGATDQSRKAILSFDGTLTAETSIIIPSVNKMYYVRNNTSGSFALKIKTAGNTAITIEQGSNVMVASDGTDVYQTAFPTSVSSFTANSFTATSVSTNVLNATKVSTSIMTAAQVSATAIHATSVSAVSGRFSGTVSASAFAGLGIIPTGMISPYAGGSAPTGFLLCFGQAVSRSTYSDLFAVVSATYGAGDGSSTFNVPDLRGRVVAGQDDMGGTAVSILTSSTPGGIDGSALGNTGGSQSNTITVSTLPDFHYFNNAAANNTAQAGSGRDAFSSGNGTSEQGSGEAHNNIQPTFILNYIIKT